MERKMFVPVLLAVVIFAGFVAGMYQYLLNQSKVGAKTYGPMGADEFAREMSSQYMYYFPDYRPGDRVIIEDSVDNIELWNTTYGPYTIVLFNGTYNHSTIIPLPKVIEGNHINEYRVGEKARVTFAFDYFNLDGHTILTVADFVVAELFTRETYEGEGDMPLVLDLKKGADGVLELVGDVIPGYETPLSNISVAIYDIENKAVDTISDLSKTKVSERGYVHFTDGDGDGCLSNGDRFTISIEGTGDKNHAYSLWFHLMKGKETIDGFGFSVWNRGVFMTLMNRTPKCHLSIANYGIFQGYLHLKIAEEPKQNLSVPDMVLRVTRPNGTTIASADFLYAEVEQMDAYTMCHSVGDRDGDGSSDDFIYLDNEPYNRISYSDDITIQADMDGDGESEIGPGVHVLVFVSGIQYADVVIGVLG